MIIVYFSIWFVMPTQVLPLLVVDKTVPEPNYREHSAIFWLTKHWRMTNENKIFRQYASDYIGYHPKKSEKQLLTKDHLDGINLLYLADTYGIYDYEKGQIDYELRLPYEQMDIDLIFGGFNPKETHVIKDYAKNKDHLLIGEHNILGYPTYLYPESSEIIQEVFGIKYNGWLVRYYEQLEDVAFWVKVVYERIYGKELNLTGPGLVLVREGNSRYGWIEDLVVFQDTDFKEQYPTLVIEKEHPLTKGAAKRIPYLYWIEILDNVDAADVLAYYEFPLTDQAAEKLKMRGINNKVPALVYYEVPEQGARIYFGGDFADQLPAFLPSWMTGSAKIQQLLSYIPGIPPQYHFYFRWFAPVLYNITDLVMP
ncbi:MAG: hypothetical protein K0S71_2312 [Clostridia bacterium]|jgi:hypothetical protein|nr:hypothetical protein [Clostridia bacterium]